MLSAKSTSRAEKIIFGSSYICENSWYIKSAVDNSVAYDKVISVMNRVSTDVTSTVLINFDNKDKKVRYKMDFYILYTFLLVAIQSFVISIICNYYKKYRSK